MRRRYFFHSSISRYLKNNVDIHRRSETTIQIRKEKKEDQINQRRKLISESLGVPAIPLMAFGSAHGADMATQALVPIDPSSSGAIGHKGPVTPVSIEKIGQYYQELFANDLSVVINATQQFRRLLSIGKSTTTEHINDIYSTNDDIFS
jgi:hypothetical protein